MRLIDADVLLNSIFKSCNTTEATINNAPTIDAVPVVRGEWIVDDESGTEWISHQCSVCKESSLSEMIYEDDYDEGLDGEWFYLGKREIGIIEHLTNYCPNCGAKMDGERGNDDA